MDDRFSIKKPIKKAIAHRAGSIGGSLAYANRNLPPHIQAAENAVALLMPILWFSVRYRMVGALILKGREMRKRKGGASRGGTDNRAGGCTSGIGAYEH